VVTVTDISNIVAVRGVLVSMVYYVLQKSALILGMCACVFVC
jgi:hypothetical protein